MNKHTATMPDGTVSTRNSKTRAYSHAVAIFSVSHGDTEATWGAVSWHGTEALAHTAARKWDRDYDARVIPAAINAPALAVVAPELAPACECAAAYLGHTAHTAGCPLDNSPARPGPSHNPAACSVRNCTMAVKASA
jgi:hypothetical protein